MPTSGPNITDQQHHNLFSPRRIRTRHHLMCGGCARWHMVPGGMRIILKRGRRTCQGMGSWMTGIMDERYDCYQRGPRSQAGRHIAASIWARGSRDDACEAGCAYTHDAGTAVSHWPWDWRDAAAMRRMNLDLMGTSGNGAPTVAKWEWCAHIWRCRRAPPSRRGAVGGRPLRVRHMAPASCAPLRAAVPYPPTQGYPMRACPCGGCAMAQLNRTVDMNTGGKAE